MSVKALRYVIATSPDTHEFDRRRLVSSEALVTLCRGLVVVEEEEEASVVRLVRE